MPPCRLLESLNLIRFAPLTPFTTFQHHSCNLTPLCLRSRGGSRASCHASGRKLQLEPACCVTVLPMLSLFNCGPSLVQEAEVFVLPFLPSFSLIQRGWVGHGTSFPQALLDVSSAVSAAAPGAGWSRPHHSQRASGDQANSGIPLPLASCHPAALYRAYRCV